MNKIRFTGAVYNQLMTQIHLFPHSFVFSNHFSKLGQQTLEAWDASAHIDTHSHFGPNYPPFIILLIYQGDGTDGGNPS